MILAALCENPSITNDIFSLTFIINITQALYIIIYLQIWFLIFQSLSTSCIHLQILSFIENSREVESSIVFGQKCNLSPLTLSIVKTLQVICWHFPRAFLLFSIFCDFLQHAGQESVSIDIHLLAGALVFLSKFLKLQEYQILFIYKKGYAQWHLYYLP